MQPDRQRSAELRKAFKEVDKDYSGSISFDQFATLLCKHSFSEFMIVDRLCERSQNRALARELGMTLVEIEDLRLDYRRYDENGDGTIDKEEFKLLLEDRLEVKLQDIPTARVQHWWRCADVNMDGAVGFAEFARFHRRFFGAAGRRTCPLEGFYRRGGLTSLVR
jgi:Ca2+-binding EF-hand superfamily protein